MDLLSLLNNAAGIISLVIIIVGGFFAIKSGVLKFAGDAQGSAISALQGEMAVLRGRIEDKDKENEQLNQKISHLDQTIETICVALKRRGLIITVQGEMISIEDKRGRTSATRIRPVRLTKQEDDKAL